MMMDGGGLSFAGTTERHLGFNPEHWSGFFPFFFGRLRGITRVGCFGGRGSFFLVVTFSIGYPLIHMDTEMRVGAAHHHHHHES